MTGSVRSAGAVAWPSFNRAALFALRACAKGSLLLASPANLAADDTALIAIGRGATLGGSLIRLVKRFERKYSIRSEEHTSELQSLMRISYAVFCLKNKRIRKN